MLVFIVTIVAYLENNKANEAGTGFVLPKKLKKLYNLPISMISERLDAEHLVKNIQVVFNTITKMLLKS